MRAKTQRVRDPLHNLVEFDSDQFEQVMWKVVQTPEFQRLRRVRQLGFSEFVYPGATHTRFAHSIGAFNTARSLMEVIERYLRRSGQQVQETQKRVALAAALVHDVGHGMFSHAFEEIGRDFKLKMAEHEHVSELLIRDSEIASTMISELGSGFANDVADVIGRGQAGNLYDAVVSSQFDADRLDYMQRDRLMTGVQNSGIDFTWLKNNLEVGEVPLGVDDEQGGRIETFVLGSKAIHAAESYILALFQLYPTVYFHKATRGAEKMFSAVMSRVFQCVLDGGWGVTGLPESHPIVQFVRDSDNLDKVLALDDTVFWGSLCMLRESDDKIIAMFADRLWCRKLLKCIDVQGEIVAQIGSLRAVSGDERVGRTKQLQRALVSFGEKIEAWKIENVERAHQILVDKAIRDPYKRFQESKGPLNQISIKGEDGRIYDIAEVSHVVDGLESFSIFRAYFSAEQPEIASYIREAINESVKESV